MAHILDHPFTQFIIGGVILSGIAYLSNNVSTRAAAALSGIPLSIPAIYFIKEKEHISRFSWNATIMMVVLVLISFAFYHSFVNLGYTKEQSLFISMLVYSILTILAYYFLLI